MTSIFLAPWFLPLLAAAPIAWLALRALDAVRRRRLAEVAGPRALPALPGLRAVRRAILASGLLFAAAGAMQPAWGDNGRTIEPRGADLVICLDVSRSMLARDEGGSRLARARAAIRALTARARGDRFALVAFAGDARLVVPLTRDAESFLALADAADPTTVPAGGSDVGAALDASLAAFRGASGEREAILLVTDGEDFGGTARAAADRCRAAGVPVHCVALGSALGAKIPVPGPRGEEFVRDAAGREVVSMPDAAGLAAVAAAGGGGFVRSADAPEPLVALYDESVVPAMRAELEAAERRRRENRFQWPLLAAFLLLLGDLAFAERSRR